MKNIFTDHPKSVGETYLQHFFFATRFGFHMITGGLACLLHAIFPFMFKRTGSNKLLQMMHHFVERMPIIEDRMVHLSQCIDKKCQGQK